MARRNLGFLATLALTAAACAPSAAASAAHHSASATYAPLIEVTTTASTIVTTSTTATTTSPPKTTTTTQLPEPVEPPKSRLVVSGVGDVNLDPRYVGDLPSIGYEEAWSGLFDVFLRDDLSIVNLECAPSNLGTPWDKPYTFRCDPEALPSMAAAGVDVANLANNHSMDYGFDAMLDGMRNLLGVGIHPVGTGANIAEASTPFFAEIDGWTVAVIGSGGVHPETGWWVAGDDRPGMTNGDHTDSIAAAIANATESADLVFVTAHWGEQGSTRPRSFERAQAEAWIEAGADGIFGHHQHRLQPLEWYRGRPIAWGLGNFVWRASARPTAIAQFVYEPDGRIGACLVPVVIERHGRPVVQDPTAPLCVPNGTR